MTCWLHRTPHLDDELIAWTCATLADALEASRIPPACWNAVVQTHPGEICTFYSAPGIVPGGGPEWIIRGAGVAAEFCAAERAAGRLPSIGATP